MILKKDKKMRNEDEKELMEWKEKMRGGIICEKRDKLRKKWQK